MVRRFLDREGLAGPTVGPNLGQSWMGGADGTSTGAHIGGEIPTGWRFVETQQGTETVTLGRSEIYPGAVQLDFAGTPAGAGKISS